MPGRIKPHGDDIFNHLQPHFSRPNNYVGCLECHGSQIVAIGVSVSTISRIMKIGSVRKYFKNNTIVLEYRRMTNTLLSLACDRISLKKIINKNHKYY